MKCATADTFGRTRIYDFEKGKDHLEIDISGQSHTGQVSWATVGPDVVVTADGPEAKGEIVLVGLSKSLGAGGRRNGDSKSSTRLPDIQGETMQPLNAGSTIRPVTPGDIAALKAVIDANSLFPSDMLDEMTAGYFNGNAAEEFWLTVDDGGPVAVAYCARERMTQGTWNLLLIAVHPDRQGQGIGAALMAYVEQKLAVRGERVLLVETSGLPNFSRTRAFYSRIGYDEEARIREFYQAGEDKIVFRKALRVTFDQ